MSDREAMTRHSPPLHILHYLKAVRLEHGGVVRSVLDLCATLAHRGHDVVLATTDATDVPPTWAQPSAPGMRRTLPRLVVVKPFASFRRQIKLSIEGAELVHIHGPWEVHNLVIAHVARQLNKPYVLTAHGMLDEWSMAQKATKKRLYHALFAKKLLERAAFVHCSAQGEQDQVQRWLGRGRGFVVPNVVDFSTFASLPGADTVRERFPFLAVDRLKLLFLSRIHHKKGLESLIDAARRLKTFGLDFTLVVAGPGDPDYVEKLQRRIKRLGLEEQTFLTGLITGVNKIALYQACDLFVLPTSQENFGLVLVESMACGTPVLTTRGTDIWREIEAGGGVICEADSATLAQTIQELASDRKALAKRGEGGREWVMRFFDVDRLLDSYESLYNLAIAHDT